MSQRQHSQNRHSSDAGTGSHNHRGSRRGQGRGRGDRARYRDVSDSHRPSSRQISSRHFREETQGDRLRQSNHHRQWNHPNGSRPRSQSTGRRTASHTSQSASDEIPGFYYDREKKKYFRIVPGATNVNASAVTRDTVRQRQAEEKRQLDLKILQSAPRTFSKDTVDMLRGRRGPRIPAAHLCSRPLLLDQLQRGTVLSADVQRVIPMASVAALQPRGHCKVLRPPSVDFGQINHVKFMLPSADYSKLLCLWELEDSYENSQRVQLLDLADIVKKDETGRVELTVEPIGTPLLSQKAILDLCYADMDASTEETSGHILYVTDNDGYGVFPGMSTAVIRRLPDTGIASESRHSQYEFGTGSDPSSNRMLWCCAWNKHKQCASLGSEKCAFLIDPNQYTNRLRLTVNTDHSDVLAQTFSKQTGHVLYSGTRRGVVLAHDTRDQDTLFELDFDKSPTLLYKLAHSTGVCHLYSSPDDIYLTVAGYSGKISRWDLRQRKMLMEYQGHCNDYHKLPVHVCEEQQLVYAVGDDSYTRLWCQRTGKLLYTLPPPYPATIPHPPTVCYSQHLGYGSGYPGLLMGVSDELHLYS